MAHLYWAALMHYYCIVFSTDEEESIPTILSESKGSVRMLLVSTIKEILSGSHFSLLDIMCHPIVLNWSAWGHMILWVRVGLNEARPAIQEANKRHPKWSETCIKCNPKVLLGQH